MRKNPISYACGDLILVVHTDGEFFSASLTSFGLRHAEIQKFTLALLITTL